MQCDIDELFQLISRADLNEFKRCLRADLVNQARIYTLHDYDYTNTCIHPVKRFEVQHEYLIHEAIKLKSVEALMTLLTKGANLLQKQKYERTEYEITYNGKVISHQNTYVSGTALKRITIFADPYLVQATFDYICEQGLYEQHPEYIEFLVAHLPKVDRAKFRIEFLKIDVGGLLPDQFENEHAYKKYLSDLGFDIANLYFTKEKYLALFTNAHQQIDSQLLRHALKVCEFNLAELKNLYYTVSENIKWIILDYNPQVDPELSAQLAIEFSDYHPVLKKKRAPSPDIIDPPKEKARKSPTVEIEAPPSFHPVASHHIQEYNHLVTKRIPLLKAKIAELKQMKKSTKNAKELELTNKSLNACQKTLEENPYYESLKATAADNDDNSSSNALHF